MSAIRSLRVAVGSVCVAALLGAAGCSSDTPAPAPSATAASTLPPPATTPVQPPTPGSTASTVKPRTPTKRKPVKLNQTAESADTVKVAITSLKAITSKAKGPGEVSGPALAITVSVSNGTGSAVDLGSAVVTLTDADGNPGAGMAGKPNSPLPGSVAPGGKATGVYVFNVAKGQRDPVVVDVSVNPEMPIVVFRGAAPR